MSSVPWSNEAERANYYKNLYTEQLAICGRIEKEIERKDRQIEELVSFQRFCETEAVKEFADKLIYKIVNTPTRFESTYYMYRDGIAFRQIEIIDIIKEMESEKMYKSPIDIIAADIMTEIVKKQEEQVFKSIQNVGVNVDKKELLKALQYDREQYQKGYADGVKDFAERLKEAGIPITGGKGYEDVNIFVSNIHIDDVLKEMVGEDL